MHFRDSTSCIMMALRLLLCMNDTCMSLSEMHAQLSPPPFPVLSVCYLGSAEMQSIRTHTKHHSGTSHRPVQQALLDQCNCRTTHCQTVHARSRCTIVSGPLYVSTFSMLGQNNKLLILQGLPQPDYAVYIIGLHASHGTQSPAGAPDQPAAAKHSSLGGGSWHAHL